VRSFNRSSPAAQLLNHSTAKGPSLDLARSSWMITAFEAFSCKRSIICRIAPSLYAKTQTIRSNCSLTVCPLANKVERPREVGQCSPGHHRTPVGDSLVMDGGIKTVQRLRPARDCVRWQTDTNPKIDRLGGPVRTAIESLARFGLRQTVHRVVFPVPTETRGLHPCAHAVF